MKVRSDAAHVAVTRRSAAGGAARLEPMTEAHLPEALRLSQQAEWPHRVEDWQFVLGLGHGTVALADGAVVGTAIWWPMGDRLAAVGMVIVDTAMRSCGLGRALMLAAMAEARAAGITEFQLCATQAGMPLYEKLGYRASVEIHQHQGIVTGAPDAGAARIVARPDLAALTALDAAATGARRGPMLAALLDAGQVAVIEAAGRIVGYSVLRDFGRGKVIGPVIARDAAEAAALIGIWLQGLQGQFVRLDTPADSGIRDLLADLGMAACGGGMEMRTAATRTAPSLRRFGLTNQALG